MAAQSRLTLLTAALVASVLSPAASAQGKRPWIDPPAHVGAPSEPSPADRKPAPVQPPSEKPAARSETPSTNSVESAAPVASERTGPGGVGRAEGGRRPLEAGRSRQLGRAQRSGRQPSLLPGASRSVGNSRFAPQGRHPTRASAVERPLELMTLQTIELPNGRRFNVLTRPRPTMFESVPISP